MLEELRNRLLQSGECISLSAPNNFGKSHLLRCLSQTNLSPDLLLVYLDFNLRADNSSQGFYELILRKLITASQQVNLRTQADRLTVHYRRLTDSATSTFSIGQSFLVGLEEFITTSNVRLVLLFDQFDQLLEELPELVFLQLRALRDHYSNRLSYITATRLPLPALLNKEAEGVAEFCELFQIVHLRGLSRPNWDNTVVALAQKEAGQIFEQVDLDQVYRLSGGHPVLTRLIITRLAKMPKEAVLEPHLRLDSELRLECHHLWESLPVEEQTALLQHLEGIETLSADNWRGTLVERGLLILEGEDGPRRIFSQVFEWYVRAKLQEFLPQKSSSSLVAALPAKSAAISPRIAFDPRREVVHFLEKGGSPPLPLAGNAALLFKYLFMRQSEPYCTKDELITAIWGNGGYSAENLDRLVSDLRQEIGDYDKQIIRTIHKRGLQMVGVSQF